MCFVYIAFAIPILATACWLAFTRPAFGVLTGCAALIHAASELPRKLSPDYDLEAITALSFAIGGVLLLVVAGVARIRASRRRC